MTGIYFLQSMNYFIPNRIEEQQHLWDMFHLKSHPKFPAEQHVNLSHLSGIRESSRITGIIPYDEYMHGGPCVESAYGMSSENI